MATIWLTIASPTTEAVVNPLLAACDDQFVPDEIHLLTNPGLDHVTPTLVSLLEDVVATYDTTATVDTHQLEAETDYGAIASFFVDSIATGTTDDTVAIDITPGRKFMSAIAFQAGLKHGADHVFYLHLQSTAYGRCYPDIPRTNVDLVDFTEVV
jgi:hypothetical protein